jgi:hypothetical protein
VSASPEGDAELTSGVAGWNERTVRDLVELRRARRPRVVRRGAVHIVCTDVVAHARLGRRVVGEHISVRRVCAQVVVILVPAKQRSGSRKTANDANGRTGKSNKKKIHSGAFLFCDGSANYDCAPDQRYRGSSWLRDVTNHFFMKFLEIL